MEKKKGTMKVERIEGTPFAIVEREDEKFVLIMGQNQCLEKEFDSADEIKSELFGINWEIAFNMCYIISNEIIKNELKKK